MRQEMRQKGLAQAALYSWTQTAQETLKLYEQVIAGWNSH
jgi:glycosyltransferase involved in cell wall biosynthesis